ncbi:1662_t:CDS:2, partial [Cetraspora pellucida]
MADVNDYNNDKLLSGKTSTSNKKNNADVSEIKDSIDKINQLESDLDKLKDDIKKLSNELKLSRNTSELQKEIQVLKNNFLAVSNLNNLKINITEYVMKKIGSQINNYIDNIDKDINTYLSNERTPNIITEYLNS